MTEPDVAPTADVTIVGVDVNEYVYVTYCRTNREVDWKTCCENIAISIFHMSKATILHFIELANSVF